MTEKCIKIVNKTYADLNSENINVIKSTFRNIIFIMKKSKLDFIQFIR